VTIPGGWLSYIDRGVGLLSTHALSAKVATAAEHVLVARTRRAIVADGVECHVMSKNRDDVVGRGLTYAQSAKTVAKSNNESSLKHINRCSELNKVSLSNPVDALSKMTHAPSAIIEFVRDGPSLQRRPPGGGCPGLGIQC